MSSDLDQESEESVTQTLVINCQNNGTYDKKIEDYTCTKVCPHPTNPDEGIMEVSLNAILDPKPEIYEEVEYWCKDEHRLVPKAAFQSGQALDSQFKEKLTSICQISGWLNETIGSFTCTQHCQPPLNYSEVFQLGYSTGDPSTIGTEVEYKCHDNRKKVVNVRKPQSDLLDALTLTCLFNGRWNKDVHDFGCTGNNYLH